MSYQRFAAVSLSIVLVTGCATVTVGTEFDSSKISKIKTGTSTKTDVLSYVGQPLRKSTSPDGISVWSYSFMTSASKMTAKSFIPIVGMNARKTERESKDLTVSFNKSEVVDACTYKTFSNKGSDQEGMASAFGTHGETISLKCEDVK